MKPREMLARIQRSANTPQRIIVAIVAPVLILSISYGIIDAVAGAICSGYGYYDHPLEDFDKTWWMWAVAIAVVGAFEVFWFRTRDGEGEK